ncbi:MAG: DUF3006 family protein [Balneolaceae bacterium]|nr:DUF3006 family protein [Balneolaceae bacterium]
MKIKAVIEELTIEKVTLLTESDEEEMVISREKLPNDRKYREGDWLQLEIVDNKIREIVFDEAETVAVRKRIERKMEKLRSRMRKRPE